MMLLVAQMVRQADGEIQSQGYVTDAGQLCLCIGECLQPVHSGALPCRFMDMESFALEAEAKAAVVLVALQGGPQANGEVQKYLEAHRIPFTGPNWQSAHLAANQVPFSHKDHQVENARLPASCPKASGCLLAHLFTSQDT